LEQYLFLVQRPADVSGPAAKASQQGAEFDKIAGEIEDLHPYSQVRAQEQVRMRECLEYRSLLAV